MIVGISSAQGQGKTTLITSLSELGYNIVPTHTARTILEEWGVTLPDVESDIRLRMAFQEEIVHRHYNTILEKAVKTDEQGVFVVERTFIDIFVYTVLSVGLYNEYSEWLDEYFEICKNYQEIFDNVVFLSGLMNVADDGVRSTNIHFRGVIDSAIQRYIYMGGKFDNVHAISEEDHDKRIKTFKRLFPLDSADGELSPKANIEAKVPDFE